MRAILLLLSSLALVAGTRCLAAGFEWKQDRVELSTDNTIEVVHAAFAYRNTGAKPVRVLVERPSCDCLVVGDSSFTVQPGADGQLRVTLRLMGQAGLVRKELWVATDEPGATPMRLEVDVQVEERILVKPRLLYWTRGDEPAAKVVTVAVRPASSAKLVAARAQDSGFELATAPGGAPGEWRLSIHPVDTKVRRNTSATLEFRAPDGAMRQVQVYLVVR